MSSQAKILSVKLAVRSTDVLKVLSKIVVDMDGLTLLTSKDAANVDILVLEIGSDPEAEFDTIRMMVQEKVVGNLFLTSDRVTPDILLPALRAGAKEFFPQPIDIEEVRAAFRNVITRSNEQADASGGRLPLGKIVSVLGSKGGVGTTTVAVNLATALQAIDKDRMVALIDMNRLTGEVPLFLDLDPNTNWEEIGKNLSRLDQAYLKSAMTRHQSGIYVLPAPGRRDAETHLPSGFLYQLIRNMRPFFDYIVVDNGMYFDDSSYKIFQLSEVIYIVAILSLPCVINVRKLEESIRQSCGQLGDGKLRIIANRYEKKDQISLAEAGKIIGADIHATIPNNYSLTMAAINSGKPVTETAVNSELAKAYRKLAESLSEHGQQKSSGRFGWFW